MVNETTRMHRILFSFSLILSSHAIAENRPRNLANQKTEEQEKRSAAGKNIRVGVEKEIDEETLEADVSGDPVVDGGLTIQEVDEVVKANLFQLRHCYKQVLIRKPDANDKIKIDYVIGGEGLVASLAIKSDAIENVELARCICAKIIRWKFPKPRGGIQVKATYPFVYYPNRS